MPIFEYECPCCGNLLELLIRNADTEEHKCRSCGSYLERILSPASIPSDGSYSFHSDED